MSEKFSGSNLIDVLHELYANEINCSITSFWDAGWFVKLGDQMNGFMAEKEFDNSELTDVAEWLKQQVAIHYPDTELAQHWSDQ